MSLFKEIEKYSTFFHSIRIHEETFMLDLKLPVHWEVTKILHTLDSGVQTKVNDGNDDYQLITFYVEKAEKGIKMLEETVYTIIKWNKDNEEKRYLLDTKIVELQKIFETNNVDSLRSLNFDFTSPNLDKNDIDMTKLKLDEKK